MQAELPEVDRSLSIERWLWKRAENQPFTAWPLQSGQHNLPIKIYSRKGGSPQFHNKRLFPQPTTFNPPRFRYKQKQPTNHMPSTLSSFSRRLAAAVPARTPPPEAYFSAASLMLSVGSATRFRSAIFPNANKAAYSNRCGAPPPNHSSSRGFASQTALP